jgi:single-stranded DNA-specific DHH superfamily exonuclease
VKNTIAFKWTSPQKIAMYFKKAVEFLKDLKEKEDVIIIFNNDADGITSCAMIMKYLSTKKIKPYIISQPMPPDKNLMKRIQLSLPKKVIFLDMAIDQESSIIKRLKGFSSILVVDHHKVFMDLNEEGVVHYNPRFDEGDVYKSTAYLTYKILSEIMSMENNLWIAAVGMIGDYNLENSKDLVEMIKKKYNINDLHDSFLAKISHMIEAARSAKALTCEEITEKFIIAKDYEDLLILDELVKPYEEIQKEIEKIKEDFEKNAEITGNLMLYNIKSKYNLSSAISTIVSGRHKNKIVIVYEKKGNKIKMSARNQGKNFDLDYILKKATKGMRASAGGHKMAAGAVIEEKDWDLFKKRLVGIAGK